MNFVDNMVQYLIVTTLSLFLGQKVNLTVSKSISNNIFIYYFVGPSVNDSIKFKLEDGLSLTKQPKFEPNKPTHFFYHGWGANATDGSSATVTQALLDAGKCNVVSFDYSGLVKSTLGPIDYIIAVYNVSYIGQAIGEFFKEYIDTSQPIELIKMASHSLGAQVMATVARTYGIGKFPKLTGLDPAGPVFNIIGVKHLEAKDGKFVDIIHTDGGLNGDDRTLGHVDFFPNRGMRVQPGCNDQLVRNPLSSCSHIRAYQYYAESILHPKIFLAKSCRRILLSNYCCCNDSLTAEMGYYVNTTVRGTYFLKTGSSAPYGLGPAGLDFN